MRFEDAYKRLSEISVEMDNGDLPLEKALELYSEAAALVESCKKDIEHAKTKISEIEKNNLGIPKLENSGNA